MWLRGAFCCRRRRELRKRPYKLTICRVAVLQETWLAVPIFIDAPIRGTKRPKRNFHLDGDKIIQSSPLGLQWIGNSRDYFAHAKRTKERQRRGGRWIYYCGYRARVQSILVIDVIPKNRFTVIIMSVISTLPFPASSVHPFLLLLPLLLLLLFLHAVPTLCMAWLQLLINFKSPSCHERTWEALGVERTNWNLS